MIVNDLKSVLIADVVLIYTDNTVQRFCYIDNNHSFWSDDNLILWDIYGECEIKQIYADEDRFCIDLVQEDCQNEDRIYKWI